MIFIHKYNNILKNKEMKNLLKANNIKRFLNKKVYPFDNEGSKVTYKIIKKGFAMIENKNHSKN